MMENSGISKELSSLNKVTIKRKSKQKSNVKYLENKAPEHWKVNLGRLLVFVAVIICWEMGARMKWIDPFFWSIPSDIFATWMKIIKEGSVWKDTLFTFQSTVYGFVIGTV